ncbi:PREDICTED: uncharacterized protein LOC108747947 [Trachymyrmex septentrionalis]|uniref:uncharacterized protein LOC108747947 n=1 Tax=Trachymyrmex septentrionalis TaxID=34720 RepID=UPI00084F293D|nr:PREDICTED: uncharacterized protein LOC108747947 [Trachymyrmex septentrionalis]
MPRIKIYIFFNFVRWYSHNNIVYISEIKWDENICLLQYASSHTILTRLLALTLTTYKFLKIGIVIAPIPHIKITIDKTRGNRILPHATWMTFIKKRVDIQRLVQLSTPLK